MTNEYKGIEKIQVYTSYTQYNFTFLKETLHAEQKFYMLNRMPIIETNTKFLEVIIDD